MMTLALLNVVADNDYIFNSNLFKINGQLTVYFNSVCIFKLWKIVNMHLLTDLMSLVVALHENELQGCSQ